MVVVVVVSSGRAGRLGWLGKEAMGGWKEASLCTLAAWPTLMWSGLA